MEPGTIGEILRSNDVFVSLFNYVCIIIRCIIIGLFCLLVSLSTRLSQKIVNRFQCYFRIIVHCTEEQLGRFYIRSGYLCSSRLLFSFIVSSGGGTYALSECFMNVFCFKDIYPCLKIIFLTTVLKHYNKSLPILTNIKNQENHLWTS